MAWQPPWELFVLKSNRCVTLVCHFRTDFVCAIHDVQWLYMYTITISFYHLSLNRKPDCFTPDKHPAHHVSYFVLLNFHQQYKYTWYWFSTSFVFFSPVNDLYYLKMVTKFTAHSVSSLPTINWCNFDLIFRQWIREQRKIRTVSWFWVRPPFSYIFFILLK